MPTGSTSGKAGSFHIHGPIGGKHTLKALPCMAGDEPVLDLLPVCNGLAALLFCQPTSQECTDEVHRVSPVLAGSLAEPATIKPEYMPAVSQVSDHLRGIRRGVKIVPNMFPTRKLRAAPRLVPMQVPHSK